MLKQIGLEFEVIPSHVSENIASNSDPATIVMSLAQAKALEVGSIEKNAFIIGADTIVVIDKDILGKPATSDEAVEMLHRLSGREHTVYTGFSILDTPSMRVYSDFEQTQVHFRHLHDEEIKEYVASGSPMDKAGAYGIQDDYGAVFIDSIQGCFYNVVGFPLAKFYIAFENFISSFNKE